jgi:hypothetical protein
MNFNDLVQLIEAKAKIRPPTQEELTYPYAAYEYAKNVAKKRVPELEPLILDDTGVAYEYAYDVVKGRWPEAEKMFSNTDPSLAYGYAKNNLKDRWINIPGIPKVIAKKAEKNIMSEPDIAIDYIKDVIKDRWYEAEPKLK